MTNIEALKIALDALNNVPIGWIDSTIDDRNEARDVIKSMIEENEHENQGTTPFIR